MLKKPLNKIRHPFLRASFTENPLPFKKLNRKGSKLKNLSNKKGLSYRIGKVQKNIIEQGRDTSKGYEGRHVSYPCLKSKGYEGVIPYKTKNVNRIHKFCKFKYIFSLGQLKAEFSRKQVQHNKSSHFKTLLEERKKCMIAYGCLNKKQMQSLFLQAKAFDGKFDENFIKIAESRLDVTLFRICFFPTIFSARQWINHGHILVNNKVITIPYYQLKGGDIITVAPDKRDKLKRRICLFIAEKIKIRAFHYSVKIKAFYAIIKSCIATFVVSLVSLQGIQRSTWSFMEQTKKRKLYNFFKKAFLKIAKVRSNKRLPLFYLLPKVFLFFSEKGLQSHFYEGYKGRDTRSLYKGRSLCVVSLPEKEGIRNENQKNQGKDTKKGIHTQLLPFLKTRNLFTKARPLRQRVASLKISGMKPLNLEVCYKKMVAIFLYSPQKVALPASIDLHFIAKSIK